MQLLLLICILLICAESVAGKTGAMPVLVKQVPKFDDSLRRKFEVKIEQTRILKTEDPSKLLKAHGGVIAAGAEKNGALLRGRAALLSGGVTEEVRESTISTVEYGVKSRFHVDLRKLTAKFAPDIAFMMEAQIADARRKLAAQVEREEQLMKQQLQARRPQVALPAMPARPTANPDALKALESAVAKSKERIEIPSISTPRQANSDLTRAMESALARSKQSGKAQADRAMEEYKAALAQAKKPVQMPSPVNNRVSIPPVTVPMDRTIPSAPKVNTATAEREMLDKLARAKLQPSANLDVDAKLSMAKKNALEAVGREQPQLDIVLTKLRTKPRINMPTAAQADPALVAEANFEKTIPWDAWHAKFAELAHKPILREVNKCGSPSGANTVEITVSPDHHIAVRLFKPSNPVFDKAILEAYKSLDGNPSLEYPAGSRRASITFLIDNQHKGNGIPSSVSSHTSVGDKEILRNR